jgi:hypothetical protein
MTQELQELVQDVSQLTGVSAPDWLSADAPTLQLDTSAEFYLIGIIGGKEVGKTALVNALAGQPLSAPTGYGRGTETAIAYAHESQANALRNLLEREAPGKFRLAMHTIDHLRNQVLLDLPDIDSRYSEHVELTRRMLRHMLFPIWIQSVEKYADQQPQKLLATVAQGNDPANFLFVLNKSDQMRPDQSEEIRRDYAQRIARVLKLPAVPQVYLISAIQPAQYELPALGQRLSRQRTQQDVTRSVQLASRQRDRSVLSWVQEQGLPERAQLLERLQAHAEELMAATLAQPLVDEVIPGILDDPGHRLALTEQVMNARVSRWPLVNLVHTLLSPILGFYRVSAAPGATSTSSLIDTHLRLDNRSISAAIQTTFASLHRTHPQVADLYRARKLWEDLPADAASLQLRSSLAGALATQRETALEKLSGRGALLAPWRWLLTIGALLWFPFIQPILEVVLQDGIIQMNREALLLIVRIFSAAYLLKAAGFLIVWFIFLWAYLRWDTGRRVSRNLARWRNASDGSTNLATAALAWVDELLDPIRQARDRTQQILQRAEELHSNLTAAA